MDNGDWATAADTLEREAGEHRDAAIALVPDMRERAADEERLAPLREREDWPAALG